MIDMPKQYAIISLEKAVKPTYNPNVAAADIDYSVSAPTRCIDMLLEKFQKRAYTSEVIIKACPEWKVPRLEKKLGEAKIALVTDGGLVPKGNPDNLTPTNASKFCTYSIDGEKSLTAEKYEISHQGYNNRFVLEDPNRLLPVDALRDLEREGVIGSLSNFFYSTAGVMTPVEKSIEFGKQIAACLKRDRADAVILSSTCGTSTRCGAYIVREIESIGIPVTHVTNLTKIAEGIGSSRILCGNSICHVFGDPSLSPEAERAYRRRLVERALHLLEKLPDPDSSLVIF